MLNAEYELLKKISASANHNRTFDPQAVPIDASNIQVYYQLIQQGYIIETSTGARLAPHTIDLLYLQQQIDEQRTQDAAENTRRDNSNKLLQILLAIFGALVTLLVAVLTAPH